MNAWNICSIGWGIAAMWFSFQHNHESTLFCVVMVIVNRVFLIEQLIVYKRGMKR